MRRALCLLALALALAARAEARSFHFGVEAGWDIRDMSLHSDFYRAKGKSGWFIGPKAALSLPLSGLQVDGAMLCKQREMSFTELETGYDKDQTLTYLVFPVNMRYTFTLAKLVGLYVATGPQWSRYVGKKGSLDCFGQLDTHIDRSTLSWNVGFGAELVRHLQVGFTYNIGIDREFWNAPAAETIRGFEAHKNSYQFRLACLF